MLKIVDQLNRPIQLREPAKRIVSLVPSISEYLYEIGLEKEVVGITKFCVKPQIWFNTKTRIGGTKSISIEKIITLKPDLILANKEENTQAEINELSKHYPVYISDIETLPQAYNCLLDIGKLVGKQQESTDLVTEIKKGITSIKDSINNVSCLYFIWQNPNMVVGKNTFINEMLNLLGIENLAINLEARYPELSDYSISNLEPKYIFLSSEPFPFRQSHLSEFKVRFPKSKVLLVDGEAFSWYGARLKYSIDYFNTLILSLTT